MGQKTSRYGHNRFSVPLILSQIWAREGVSTCTLLTRRSARVSDRTKRASTQSILESCKTMISVRDTAAATPKSPILEKETLARASKVCMALYVRCRVDQGRGGVRFSRDMHVCCTEFNLISEIPSPSSTPFRWAFTGMGQRSIFPPRPARETHRHAVGAVGFQYCRHARACEYHLICK